MNAIETHSLAKNYGKLEAVRGIDLNVREGSVYGFLGPNGAGKSTTIGMLMGFIKPTGGDATVLGHDVRKQHYEIRKVTGYLPERPAFYDNMSGEKNMEYFGRLVGASDLNTRIPELLRKVGLEGRGRDRVGTYSHGMRQRLGIAIALLGNPKLLILDEPTTGLDPMGSHDVRQIIKELKHDNITIFLSSHILHEVQEICDVVGIVKKGKLAVEMPMEKFLKSTKGNLSVIEITAPKFDGSYVSSIQKIKGVERVELKEGKIVVTADDPAVAEEVNISMINAGYRVREIKEVTPTLEDAFLKVINEEKVEA